jgi:Galactose oxidase, central domain
MMTGAARVVVVALCALTPLTSPQTGSPPRRAHHALVYDDRRQVVLMTGGSTPLDGGQRFEFFNDLWAFGDSGWRSLSESGERVSGIGLAYDDRRGQVLSFGGYNGQSLGDLRRLESDQWQLIGRVPEIAAAEPGFVYDSKRDRLVVFGGSAGPGRALGETWEYDGAAWTRVAGPAPPARQAHAMVYDARRGRTVLFGGMGVGPQGQAPPALGDTWEYDGTGWVLRDGPAPPPRHGAGVAYDSHRGLVILFGGAGADGFLGDTWAWNGTVWRQLSATGPEARAMGYIAYDKRRDRVVLFGGRKGWPDGDLGDTWEWDGTRWQRSGN